MLCDQLSENVIPYGRTIGHQYKYSCLQYADCSLEATFLLPLVADTGLVTKHNLSTQVIFFA